MNDTASTPVRDAHDSRLVTLTLAALGVVYGDIGTSPLYALKEVFGGTHHPVPIDEANVLGILSVVFWALMLVVSVKYIVFIMRANNRGEGGIMALMALVRRGEKDARRARVLMIMGLFGAALFYGDGMITPAIWSRSFPILSGFLKDSFRRSFSSMIWPARVNGPST